MRENHTVDLGNRFDTEILFPGKDICGIQVFGDKIFNGEVADIDEFPWMALLFYEIGEIYIAILCDYLLLKTTYKKNDEIWIRDSLFA